MKHRMSLVVYSNTPEQVFRKDRELPDITPDEYDALKHSGKIYAYPENFPVPDSMYVWQWCVPENIEEEHKLIEMGKWGTLSSK